MFVIILLWFIRIVIWFVGKEDKWNCNNFVTFCNRSTTDSYSDRKINKNWQVVGKDFLFYKLFYMNNLIYYPVFCSLMYSICVGGSICQIHSCKYLVTFMVCFVAVMMPSSAQTFGRLGKFNRWDIVCTCQHSRVVNSSGVMLQFSWLSLARHILAVLLFSGEATLSYFQVVGFRWVPSTLCY